MDTKLYHEKDNVLAQLWNILPYSGLWSPTICGIVDNFSTPEVKESFMIGIPYAGDNTGQNPNLRLMTFSSTSNGPISSVGVQGVQMLFFNNLLNHKVNWEIKPIGKNNNEIRIGFYSSNYLSQSTGNKRIIPMLATSGPTFYKTKPECRKGKFTITSFNDMYVIVDAQVSVELHITYEIPEPYNITCMTELYKVHKTYINEDCKKF